MQDMKDDLVKLFIHYNVDDHFIPMSDFLTASVSAEKIITDLNNQFYGGKLKYQLVITPPEDGTFLKSLGFWVVVGATIVSPIAEDYVLGAFKEITKHPPSHYGQQHIKALRDLAMGFFSMEVEQLERCMPHHMNLDRAFKAKSDFYTSCQSNNLIKGVGFDDTKSFPIQREHFKNHISKDRIRAVDSDFYIYEAILVSPVTIDKDIKWELQDRVTKTKISAYMRDDSFKTGLLNGKYPVKQSKENDILTVQVEYKKQERNGEIVTKEVCIDTVYDFNEIEITKIPQNLLKGKKIQKHNETPMDKIW
jgi:hypothetical protein